MINVIQVFKSVYAIDKSQYNSESRSMIKEWPDHVQSKNGYVNDNVLIERMKVIDERKVLK
jgi:hypothetical protein